MTIKEINHLLNEFIELIQKDKSIPKKIRDKFDIDDIKENCDINLLNDLFEIRYYKFQEYTLRGYVGNYDKELQISFEKYNCISKMTNNELFQQRTFLLENDDIYSEIDKEVFFFKTIEEYYFNPLRMINCEIFKRYFKTY